MYKKLLRQKSKARWIYWSRNRDVKTLRCKRYGGKLLEIERLGCGF